MIGDTDYYESNVALVPRSIAVITFTWREIRRSNSLYRYEWRRESTQSGVICGVGYFARFSEE